MFLLKQEDTDYYSFKLNLNYNIDSSDKKKKKTNKHKWAADDVEESVLLCKNMKKNKNKNKMSSRYFGFSSSSPWDSADSKQLN